jgi:hypothetical protein
MQVTPFTPTATLNINTQSGSNKMQIPTPAPVVDTQATPPPEAPKEEPKKEEVDPRFLAMAKKEKALRERELKLQAQMKEQEERLKKYLEEDELWQKDKYAAAQKKGLTYEEWTNAQLGEMNLTPEQIAERKANEIVEKRLAEEAARRQQEEQHRFQEAYQHALNDLKEEAKSFTTNSQEFPLVKNTDSFDTIVSLIEQNYHQTGKILTVEEATKMVEQSFKEDLNELYKLLNPQKEEPKPQPIPAQTKPLHQTLTNKQTVSPTPATPTNETWVQKRQRLVEKYS